MNTTNKINVNYSSLVGLKAELLRKQSEINETKAKNEARPTVKPKPKTKKAPKPSKLPDELKDPDDMKQHTKSKLMLEAKTRLYDNLKKSHTISNPNYLVDFTNKSDSEEEPSVVENTYSDLDEDDWVEYVDCFGRTRKCLLEDLASMKEKDKLLSEDVLLKSPKDTRKTEEFVVDTKCTKEPEIEVMRRKWEDQMAKLANKSDIHYQDVLFDEARAHGVGYYAFSQDEEEREKQQEILLKMRKDTEQKQKEAQDAREIRHNMEQNRLKAARIRQRIRAGLPPELTEEEIAEINAKYNISSTPKEEPQEATEANIDESKKVEKNPLAVVEDKINAFGELLGKRNKWYEMSQEEWVEKRRKVRDEEFAPKYANFRKGESIELNAEEKCSSDNENCDIIGPLPPGATIDCSSEQDIESPQKLLSNEDLSSSSVNNNSTLNSASIIAGLKFLREQFEENHKT